MNSLTGSCVVLVISFIAGCGSEITIAEASGQTAGAGGTRTAAVSAGAGGATASGSAVGSTGGAPSVGSDAPCIGDQNVIYLDGDPGNGIYMGTTTITDVMPSVVAYPILVQIQFTQEPQFFDATFASDKFPASPGSLVLETQVYTNVAQFPSESAGEASELIVGDGVGCDSVRGQFQIEEIVFEAGALKKFTATFEQTCDGASSPMLRGCVHFQQ